MKVAVIGSRTFNDKLLMFSVLDELPGVTTIVSGGAPGADRLAEGYAKARNLELVVHEADWNNTKHPEAVIRVRYGREYDSQAGFRRNKTIVDEGVLVLAFWDGRSNGTRNALEYAKSKGKEVKIINFIPKEVEKTKSMKRNYNLHI